MQSYGLLSVLFSNSLPLKRRRGRRTRDFISIRNTRTRWETYNCSVIPTSESFNRCRSRKPTWFCLHSLLPRLFNKLWCPLLVITCTWLSCYHQNEKCHLLIEHETQKLKELDEEHSQELKDWREKLRPRKKVPRHPGHLWFQEFHLSEEYWIYDSLLVSFRLWRRSSHANCRNRKYSLRWAENLNVSTQRPKAESPNSTLFQAFSPQAHNLHAVALFEAPKGCFCNGVKYHRKGMTSEYMHGVEMQFCIMKYTGRIYFNSEGQDICIILTCFFATLNPMD